jgi:hypothetical protein
MVFISIPIRFIGSSTGVPVKTEPNASLPLILRHFTRAFILSNSAVNQVPLGRYVAFVGSLLLAMLFFADRYLSGSPFQTFQREARDVDRSIIRISSAHRWPERIVFDTNLATIVPPPREQLAEATRVRPLTEAFAQVIGPLQKASEYPSVVKPKRKFAKCVTNTRVAAYRPTETLPAGW